MAGGASSRSWHWLIRSAGVKAQFVVGRIVTGLGNGMNTSSIPTYQAECAKTKNRGLLICIEGGSIAFGTRKLLLFLGNSSGGGIY